MPVVIFTGDAAQFPRHSLIDPLVEDGRAARALFTDAVGEHYAFQLTPAEAAARGISHPDRVIVVGLRTPSAATLAETEAAAAAELARQQKIDAARDVVRAQVARVRAIAPASRTNQDRWLMALSFLIFTEE